MLSRSTPCRGIPPSPPVFCNQRFSGIVAADLWIKRTYRQILRTKQLVVSSYSGHLSAFAKYEMKSRGQECLCHRGAGFQRAAMTGSTGREVMDYTSPYFQYGRSDGVNGTVGRNWIFFRVNGLRGIGLVRGLDNSWTKPTTHVSQRQRDMGLRMRLGYKHLQWRQH